MYDVILTKRNGNRLSREQIAYFVQGFSRGEIPDYQVSALMMAIYFRGLNREETFALVEEMLSSGDRLDLSPIRGIKVDKHSTGGVGDKTSIVLAPLVAAAGVPVAKMTGRGLGHTGGTMDKLESFRGMRVELDEQTFFDNVNRIGLAITGQTGNLAPADKKLYALRDVTGTVENLGLIAGSIMSKKLAAGADAIVLDVKYGDGAFMKTPEMAIALAEEMVAIGEYFGKRTVALLSSMEAPLGYAVGNALEIREALDTLRGHGPADLHELCLRLGTEMLLLGGKAENAADARARLESLIGSGAALQKLADTVAAQGGDPSQVFAPETLPTAPHSQDIPAPHSGYVHSLHAEAVGIASMLLGAGRETKDSTIDLGAGILLRAKPGDFVEAGQPLASLFTSDADRFPAAAAKLLAAYSLQAQAPATTPLLLGRVDRNGYTAFN